MMTGPAVLGVDLGGTKIDICRVSRDGKHSEILRIPTMVTAPRDQLAASLLDAVAVFLEKYREEEPPLCIGFGLKDHVDRQNGIWVKCPATPDFYPMPLADMVRERFGLPAVLDNDVHVAALAEMHYGAGREYKDFVYLNVGTGISMCAISDRQLVRGAMNYAGEIGHLSVDTNGEECDFCHQRGCLEEIASGGAIIAYAKRELAKWPGSALEELAREDKLTSKAIFRQADAGDAFAVHISTRALEALLVACSAIVNIFNPEAIIFGGGVMTDGWMLERIRRQLPGRVIATSRAGLKSLALSSLGSDHVGVLGAGALAWEYILSGERL